MGSKQKIAREPEEEESGENPQKKKNYGRGEMKSPVSPQKIVRFPAEKEVRLCTLEPPEPGVCFLYFWFMFLYCINKRSSINKRIPLLIYDGPLLILNVFEDFHVFHLNLFLIVFL